MDIYTVWYTQSEFGYIRVNANSSEEAASKANELIKSGKDEINWTECSDCYIDEIKKENEK